MKLKYIILIILILLLFSLSIFYTYRFLTSPLYSLYRIQQSIKEKNKELFLQYVDLDSIINNFIDQILEEEKKDLNSSFDNLMVQMKIKLIENYRTNIEIFLKYLILSYFDVNITVPNLREEIKSLLPLSFPNLNNFKNLIDYIFANDVLYMDKNTAMVNLTISSKKALPVILQLQFVKVNSFWKLIQIKNLYKLLVK